MEAAPVAPARAMPLSVGDLVTRTPELLELILLNLDMRTVLRVQTVSASFHSTIHTSPKLRRKLWLSPRTTGPTPSSDREADQKAPRMLNPLILDHKRQIRIKDLYLWHGISKPGEPRKFVADIIFPSLGHACALTPGTWCEMLVVQPHHESVEWNLGFYEGGKVRSVGFRFLQGPPTMGELVDALLEHFVPGYTLLRRVVAMQDSA